MTCPTNCPTCGQDLPGNITTVDLRTNTIISGGVALTLSPRQAEAAHLLWHHRPRVLTLEYMADEIFKDQADGMSCLRTMVYRIRLAIEEAGLPIWIKTVRGRGYAWVDVIEQQKTTN